MRVLLVSICIGIFVVSCGTPPKYLVKGMHENASKSSLDDARYLAVVDALCHVAEYEGVQESFSLNNKIIIDTRWQTGRISIHQVMTFTNKYKLLSRRIELTDNGDPICRIERNMLILSKMKWKDILKNTGFALKRFRNSDDTLIAELVKE